MIRHRSRLPLALVLVFAIGLLLWGPWSHRFTGGASSEDVSPAAMRSGEIPEGFGPIPLAHAPDQDPVSPPGRDAAIASGEMRNLAARMSRETGDLKVVTHPDGRRSVSLEGRFLHMSAVVIGVDGQPEIRCFNDYQQMAAELPAEPTRPETHVR